MNWIETLQKVIPWVAGLNVAPKIALSVILSTLNVLCLMLIWMPARKSEDSPSGPRMTGRAEAIAKSPLHSGAWLDNRYELARLKSILFDLIQLQASNAPFPSVLRHYAKHPDPHGWETVMQTTAKLASIATELNNSLAAFKDDLIFEDIGTYRSICVGLHECLKVYESLTSFKSPSSPDEMVQLTRIAASYDRLVGEMISAQEALAQYAVRKNRRRPKAQDRHYESAFKIVSALNHHWLRNAGIYGAGTQWYDVPGEDEYRFALPFATPETAADNQKHYDVLSLLAVPPGLSSMNEALRLSREGNWLVLRVPAAILRKLAESAEGGRWPLPLSRKSLAHRRS